MFTRIVFPPSVNVHLIHFVMALLAICGSETTAAGCRLFNISEAFSSVSRRMETGVVQTGADDSAKAIAGSAHSLVVGFSRPGPPERRPPNLASGRPYIAFSIWPRIS